MSKHSYGGNGSLNQIFRQATHAGALGLFVHRNDDGYEGRHRLPDVRFSQELPGGTVYWSVNRKNFFRRDDSLPSGWVQRIYPRVATSFRTAE
ncbi:hypothetical protein PBI_EDTHERSON_43 [Mycobacterium phage Edtherson]|uniref:hypothetical protein n=1 Tax=Mycobacterium phage Edtherson TaxID=1567468 RepID=UPI000572A931|nr:hypothetical protein PBI_EDTHERSON_43 [Mycobacterium phage Edtherson]AJA43062.1 hypothetical protein PBI_EDTHERSON_43 [Mycobacterium phage Edtherson]AJA43525.1 hypothetical protein PBI_TREDDLE_44 [Mycobacterium phage Treddle]UVK60595.1 hypothetical protein SEA_PETERSON_45 [Mycobacterium phage Peterson]